MTSPRKSLVSYRAAANLFFVLTAIVIALAGMLPSKPASASKPEIKTPAEITKKAAKKSSAFNSEEWLLLAKVL